MSMASSYAFAVAYAGSNRRQHPPLLGMLSQHSSISLSSSERRAAGPPLSSQNSMEGAPPAYEDSYPPSLMYNGKYYRFEGDKSYLARYGDASKKRLKLPVFLMKKAFPELDGTSFGKPYPKDKDELIFRKEGSGCFYMVNTFFPVPCSEACILTEEKHFLQGLVGAIQEEGVAPETVGIVWEESTL